MEKWMKRAGAIFLIVCFMMGLSACGNESDQSGSGTSSDLTGQYYLDLSELGMKLTVYLNLNEDGSFIFSNTLDFTTDKSSGTVQKSEDTYMLVFTSVNGEERSVSEGLTAGFVLLDDGSLDFSVGNAVPYGSANISTVSADDPTIKLIARPVTDDFQAPSTESAFQIGTYTTDMVEEDGVYYTHMLSFYEDETYLHTISWYEGQTCYASETGTYGISTTQLALEPAEEDRVECEVMSGTQIKASILLYPGSEERQSVTFTKVDMVSQLAVYQGGDAAMTVYEDGSYEITAAGFTETGVVVMDSNENICKQYPDHPETTVRGLNQISTVPASGFSDGTIAELRARTSESLTRTTYSVSE